MLLSKLIKSPLPLITIGFLLALSSSSYAGQKLTVVNNTDYYINLEIEMRAPGYDKWDSPWAEIDPRTTKEKSYASWYIGWRHRTISRGQETWAESRARNAKLSIWKKDPNGKLSDLKTLKFTYTHAPNTTPTTVPWDSVYTVKDPTNNLPANINFKIEVQTSNEQEGSAWSISANDFYSDYKFVITQTQTVAKAEQTVPKEKPGDAVTNPGAKVNDDQILYSDVLIDFNNQSTFPLEVKVGSQSFKINANNSKNNFKLQSKDMFIPMEIYIPNYKTPAEFSGTKNTVSKYLRQVTPSQDVITGTPSYVVKLKVTPKYSKRREGLLLNESEKKQPWKVKYEVMITVEKL